MSLQRLIRFSCKKRLPFQPFVTHSVLDVFDSNVPEARKWFHKTAVYCKRRKTAEERKTPQVLPAIRIKPKHEMPPVKIWMNMTVEDLAMSMDRDVGDMFEAMSLIPNTAPYKKANSVISDPNVIKQIVKKCARKFIITSPPSDTDGVPRDRDVTRQPPPCPEDLVKRAPVVTVMGHVDHGKTTLLDSLRNTRVVDAEFGGITQHIGAFSVKLKSGEQITFMDTPGHAAFTSMRARGAEATDIVILVVAAEDGVMEQTVESIKMANHAKVPIIVALNKIDKPTADIERSKQMLMQQGIHLEDFGGEVQLVPISALKGTNLDLLAEAIVLQAEVMDLKGDPCGLVEGVVIESKTDPRRGKLSTAIVKRGTLRRGAVLVAGTAWAKVRVMFDDEGRTVDEAPPSTPVQVLGWRELPSAGEEILEVASEKVANDVIRWREQQLMAKKQEGDEEAIKKKADEHLVDYKAKLEKKRMMGYKKSRRTGPREKEARDVYTGPQVNVVVKGDVDGSVEAILDVLETYDCGEQCRLNVVHYGVGFVSESDVEIAEAFNAVIYGFNVQTPQYITKMIKAKNVSLRPFNVIYRLIEDLKKELSKQLPAKDEEEVIGEANVLQHFEVTEGKKKMPVAGCRCTKGELKKAFNFRVLRMGEALYEGKIYSMRHLKNEVNSIKKDVECGLMFSDFSEQFQLGDTIICYQIKSIPQTTSWDPGF